MSQSLKIIATPIGNLQDISLRAKSEIEQALVILAEDTRHTKSLVLALGLNIRPDCKWYSCNAQKEKERIDLVCENLTLGKSVVLISDAGTPCISDPGSLLVDAIIKKGHEVSVIPGACALIGAIMGAGLDCTRFAFLGFLPQKKSHRKKLIMNAAQADLALVIYDSANRTQDLLDELFDYLGERRVVVARELTKLYETFHRGILGQKLNPEFINKGECVVVIEKQVLDLVNMQHVEQFIKKQLKLGNSKKDVVTLAQKEFSLQKSVIYKMVTDA